ncbi:MAG: PorT family protein [Prevotella sp.]|nr:PorT family protein [Prevotella sp.]
MKKIFLMAVMSVAVLSANAQARFDEGTITIQPRIGATGAQMTHTPKLQIQGMPGSIDKEPVGGFFIGADAEYYLTDRIGLSAGINFAQAGSGWKDTDILMSGAKLSLKDMKIQTTYLNIPLMFNYYVLKGFALKAGLQMSFLTNAKAKAKATVDYGGGLTRNEDYNESVKDDFKKFDLAIPIGLSYDFKFPISLDLRYNIGLLKVNKEGDKSSRNMVCDLTIGYKFALK